MKRTVFPRLTLVVLVCFSLLRHAHAISGTWNPNPANGDWNLSSNWSGMAVPNGPADVATFGLSSITSVFLSASAEVDRIVFNAGASSYTITASPTRALKVSGAGIVNDSGVTQTLVAAGADSSGFSGEITFNQQATLGASIRLISNGSAVANRDGALIDFRDAANAGSASVTVNGGAIGTGRGGYIRFFNSSNAGHAVLAVNGAVASGGDVGHVQFFNSSTAADAVITNNGGVLGANGGLDLGGELVFLNNATAGRAAITNHGGNVATASGGITRFEDNSSASGAMLANNGSLVDGGDPGFTGFYANATAADSVIVNNGAVWGYTTGGRTAFGGHSSAGASTLIANGGPGGALTGGSIYFEVNSSGGTARVDVSGNGYLDIRQHNGPSVGIGSLEGSGTVFLGGNNLLIGSNNRSTEFSGVVRFGGPFGPNPTGGSITKVGTGTLVLSGQNTYTGLTTVNGGKLIINGSVLTPVIANGGALGGTGTLGATTIHSGATLSPGESTGVLQVTGDLTLALGATYLVELNGTTVGTQYDQTVVNGSVLLGGATLSLVLGFEAVPGMMFTIVDNDGTDAVSGIFGGLPEGATFGLAGHSFGITYQGGTGNDVVVTIVVPEPRTWLLLSAGALFIILQRRPSRGPVLA